MQRSMLLERFLHWPSVRIEVEVCPWHWAFRPIVGFEQGRPYGRLELTAHLEFLFLKVQAYA